MRTHPFSTWLLAALAASPVVGHTQTTSAPGTPPGAYPGVLPGMLPGSHGAGSARTAAPPADGSPQFPDRRAPGGSASPATPALQLGAFRVGDNEAAYQSSSSEQRVEVRVQYGRQSGTTTGINAARLIDEHLALGLNATLGPEHIDLVLNSLYSLPSQWHAGLSLGYLERTDTYSFFSGPARASASQASHRLSLQKSFDSASPLSALGLQWYGARVLSTRSSENITTEETPTELRWWLDPRRLAPGRLSGWGATLQARPWEGAQLRLALGVEQLRYRYQDGSGSSQRRGTASLDISQQLAGCWRLDGGLTSGVASQQWRASIGHGIWSLSLGRVNPRQGMPGDTTLALSVELPLDGSPTRRCAAGPATRSTPGDASDASGTSDASPAPFNRLEQVYRRPSELPTTILAKVDPTARPYLLASFDKTINGPGQLTLTPEGIVIALPEPVLAFAELFIDGQSAPNLGSSGAPLVTVRNGAIGIDIRHFPNPGPGVAQTVQAIFIMSGGQNAIVTFNVVGS